MGFDSTFWGHKHCCHRPRLSTGLSKLSSSILSCDVAGGIICVLWFGARLVVENKLSPGELSTFVIYAVYVGSNVGQLAGVVSSLVQVHSPRLADFCTLAAQLSCNIQSAGDLSELCRDKVSKVEQFHLPFCTCLEACSYPLPAPR